MSTVIPYIPQTITVHMGPPNSNAENITLSFPDYIKNVTSSEIYPTWEPSAIRANILAIVSFALNRVYTEFYTSQGYPFQITSTTAYDQAFVKNRNIFENIGQQVDALFNSYIRRKGFVEPLSAKFCNGTTSTCAGLSQWGSQEMALAGANSMEILQRYYGDNIELVSNAPVVDLQYSYPGSPLRNGDSGSAVQQMQVMVNRIGRNYPAIPRINPVDGRFGLETQRAIETFQRIFNLTPDGIVGNATWYKLVYIYVAVLQLAELNSLGQQFYANEFSYTTALRLGDTGEGVRVLQYMLSIIGEFYPTVLIVAIDGVFGGDTQQSVLSFQRLAGIPMDGVVGEQTWNALYQAYTGILEQVDGYANVIPEANRPNLTTRYGGAPLTFGTQDQGGNIR